MLRVLASGLFKALIMMPPLTATIVLVSRVAQLLLSTSKLLLKNARIPRLSRSEYSEGAMVSHNGVGYESDTAKAKVVVSYSRHEYNSL